VTAPPRSPEPDQPRSAGGGRAPDTGDDSRADSNGSSTAGWPPRRDSGWTTDPLDVDAAEVSMVPHGAVAVFQGTHTAPRSSAAESPPNWPITGYAEARTNPAPTSRTPVDDIIGDLDFSPFEHLVRPPHPQPDEPPVADSPATESATTGSSVDEPELVATPEPADSGVIAKSEAVAEPESAGEPQTAGEPECAGEPETMSEPDDRPDPNDRTEPDDRAVMARTEAADAAVEDREAIVATGPIAGHPPVAARSATPAIGPVESGVDASAAGVPRVVDHIDFAYAEPAAARLDIGLDDDAWFAGLEDVPGVPPKRTPRTPAAALPPGPDGADESTRRGRRPGRELVPAGDLPLPAATLPAAPRYKDRDAAVDLAITEVAGHLTFTSSTVTAWYSIPEVRWAFRPDAEREALISAIAEQYASLAGFRLHLRRTTRPFPIEDWARTVDRLTPAPLPDVPGATTWADHLVAAQHHLHANGQSEGQTYLGVTFARRSFGATFKERISHLFGKGVPEGERKRMARTVEQFDEVLGAFGMRGRRATAHELEWLLYRSVALGMSAPTMLSPVDHGDWETGDLLALTEQIERYRTPYGTTVKLVNRLTGEERHVAVLSVGRMEPLEIPERHEPWLHFHERLPWPTEISSRVDILGPGDSFRKLEHRLRMIRSQQLDYVEHGMDAPPELERLAQRALHIGDEMTTGLPVDSSRGHGWHRIAISGDTREECLERARRLTTLYARELRIALQHPKNQDQLAREFIPGEPVANTGYVRRMPTKLLAAALPQAASNVGDGRGDLIGRTAGTSRRPVFVDLHFPMEIRERSGLAVFVAEPGGGKSTLLGALGYLAARRGVQVTLLDPSGPLARLAAMPELAPYARVLNLTGSEQGTLAPYALIPTPLRPHFEPGPAGDREYEIALSNARAERRMLVQDICAMLIPPQVAREASTATLLRHAVRSVRAEETSTLDDIVRCLAAMGDDTATELAHLLLDTAEMPLAMLFFGAPPPGLLGADAALTVITMAGLRLPDLKIEREYWSAEEALALPMLHTAHRLAVRRCYGGSMHTRKLVGLDEGHFMEGWRSGRSFLVRLARDSRKWNLAALVASQNPRDILGLDVQNLVSTVFVGRIASDPEVAAEALRMLRVPTDVGYEETLASLSAADAGTSDRLGFREFVMRDVDGRVQKVRVDVSYVPDLLTYLDTTPTAGLAGLVSRTASA
jgi:AAA-like domain